MGSCFHCQRPASSGNRKRRLGRLGLQIVGEPVALAFDSPVVASVGEQAHSEQRDSLHLLVASAGKAAMA